MEGTSFTRRGEWIIIMEVGRDNRREEGPLKRIVTPTPTTRTATTTATTTPTATNTITATKLKRSQPSKTCMRKACQHSNRTAT